VELTALLEDLGPTFIKVGQILGARPDLLPVPLTSALMRLHDHVSPIAPELARQGLETGLGRPLTAVFAQFEGCPIASASIAQVHRARMLDGREVAVKIQRPGIADVVDGDFRLFYRCARWLGRIPGLKAVPFTNLVRELEGPVRMQLDFKREAQNMRALNRNFLHMEHLKIPALVEELCTGSVITMEYIPGLKCITSAEFSFAVRKTAALSGLRMLYKMIFLDGLVHADMHPGNLFLHGSGELVLLDMGFTVSLGPADRLDFVDFFFGLVNNHGLECARILCAGATYFGPRFERAAFEKAISELVASHSVLKSKDFEITRFVFQLIAIQRRFGMRGSTSFIMAVISMVVFDGICKQIYPDCDFQKEARPFLIKARYQGARAVVHI